MELPPPLEAYFEADRDPAGAAPTSAFARDATVEDEGATHTGHEAIAAWWRAAKARYRHVAVPLALTESGDVTEVRATVTGDFKGSPADLTFAFRLRDGAIVGLRIGA